MKFTAIVCVVAAALLLAGGCASTGDSGRRHAAADDLDLEADYAAAEAGKPATPDPLEPWNRAMFQLNDKLYLYLLKPVSQGYAAVVPEIGRESVSNAFRNLRAPVRVVSSLLQNNPDGAYNAIDRFLINSTVGVLGLRDPAAKVYGIAAVDEDLGQTLGAWGCPPGIYLFWPVLGPSNLRDTTGDVADYYLDPVSYLKEWEARAAVRATEAVNETSLRLGDYEEMKAAALDPYVAMRDGYMQRRRAQVKEQSGKPEATEK